MEVLFHFIFELIKIAILAGIYSAILLFIFQRINKANPKSWFQKVTSRKTKFWLISGAIISILFFGWMSTYWGNHGLGDSARIPIGYNKEINQINGTWSYISPKGAENENYKIYSFAVTTNYCVGQTNPELDQYFIWNLKTDDVETLNSITEYEIKAKTLNLPKIKEFQEFWTAYNKYWNGWRLWLLP